MNEPVVNRDEALDDTPPLFASWHSWYALVIVTLILLICLFYWITKLYT